MMLMLSLFAKSIAKYRKSTQRLLIETKISSHSVGLQRKPFPFPRIAEKERIHHQRIDMDS